MANPTPTREAYGELQQAYDFFNKQLFEGGLPPCLITMQRESARVYGYFSHKRFVRLADGTTATDEIAMNPLHFGRAGGVEAVLSTLVHEMVHLWQAHHGKPSRSAYHNKQWAAKMKEIGLYPSDTGEVGGKEVGQKMTHYIVAGGAFAKTTAKLTERGFHLSWVDVGLMAGAKPKKPTRVKYTCPDCGANAWGKPELVLFCGGEDGDEAYSRMLPEETEEAA
jgi:SprT-like family